MRSIEQIEKKLIIQFLQKKTKLLNLKKKIEKLETNNWNIFHLLIKKKK